MRVSAPCGLVWLCCDVSGCGVCVTCVCGVDSPALFVLSQREPTINQLLTLSPVLLPLFSLFFCHTQLVEELSQSDTCAEAGLPPLFTNEYDDALVDALEDMQV